VSSDVKNPLQLERVLVVRIYFFRMSSIVLLVVYVCILGRG
jgi:hypothetical protein